jgi:V/A-type H+-transporting ATPase subunit D
MAIMNVNPTRMELTRLKKRLVVARRGHKLLKDKRDELMKKFLELVRKNKDLREKVEEMMMDVHSSFLIARSIMSSEVLEEALMFPKQTVSLEASSKNIMSVDVPILEFSTESRNRKDIYPYGFATTSAELDNAITALYQVMPYLLELAQIEKSAQLLAEEIEKTRRRVNALEYVLIPQLTDTIKYITMKLDENERGNLTRLMKVKDMMIEQARNVVKYVLPIILLSFMVTGCSLFAKKETELLPPLEEPKQIQYSTMEVQKGSIIKEIKDSATIGVSSETVIYSKYGGRLKELYVNKGDMVEEGDILAEFETDSLEVKCQQYETALEKANLNATQTITQIEREIKLAQLQLEKLTKDLSEKDLLKETVFAEGGSSAKSLEEDIEIIKGQIVRQEVTIEGLREKLEITKTNFDIDIMNIEYQLQQVQKELESAVIVTPVEGMIYDVSKLNLGENVGAYYPILTIVKLEDVQIIYSGLNIKHFEVGMKVKVFFDQEEFEGEVAVSPAYVPKDAPANTKETVIINIKDLTIETITKGVRNLRVNLILDEKNDVVVVPKRVLQNYLGNKYVYVLEDGIKKQRFVEIGTETNLEAEIIKGLEAGEIIIDA